MDYYTLGEERVWGDGWGVVLPASTQWEVGEKRSEEVSARGG